MPLSWKSKVKSEGKERLSYFASESCGSRGLNIYEDYRFADIGIFSHVFGKF